MKKEKIGLITFHSAYNIGSVLQAYATIETLKSLGYDVEMVDYRTPSQTLWYQKLFSRKYSFKQNVLNAQFLLISKRRKERAKKYEDFITNRLSLSKHKYTSYNELLNKTPQYDILISGSDQIWNEGCGEFRFEAEDAIYPYFLRFGDARKKIAYASSFGPRSLDDISKYREFLSDYTSLSTREPLAKEYIQKVTGKGVKLVCDPTWLLEKNDWLHLPELYKPNNIKPYILIYTLGWNYKNWKSWTSPIKDLAKRLGMEIYCISPLSYNKDKEIRMLNGAGPIDFLSYLASASLVITTTFHGTIFPMNFNIPFYSCDVRPNSRQDQILSLCHLGSRIINNPELFYGITDIECDYSQAKVEISNLRKHSIEYLISALNYEQ